MPSVSLDKRHYQRHNKCNASEKDATTGKGNQQTGKLNKRHHHVQGGKFAFTCAQIQTHYKRKGEKGGNHVAIAPTDIPIQVQPLRRGLSRLQHHRCQFRTHNKPHCHADFCKMHGQIYLAVAVNVVGAQKIDCQKSYAQNGNERKGTQIVLCGNCAQTAEYQRNANCQLWQEHCSEAEFSGSVFPQEKSQTKHEYYRQRPQRKVSFGGCITHNGQHCQNG